MDEQLKDVIKASVRETLMALGADVGNPIEMQKDFAHIRKHRLAQDVAGTLVRRVAIITIVTGGVTALWLGFRDMIGK